MSLEGPAHYKSLDGRMRNYPKDGSHGESPEPMLSAIAAGGAAALQGHANQPDSQQRIHLV